MKPQDIKTHRKLKGMTQAQLARRIGVTTRAVQNYEAGDRTPDYKLEVKLMRALGCGGSCPACGARLEEKNVSLHG